MTMTDATDTLAILHHWQQGDLSEGQAAEKLRMSRLEARTLRMDVMETIREDPDDPPAQDAAFASAPWDWSPQQGEPGHCYQAQVWGADGDAIATIESYPDPQTANDRARLIAAAGTAAGKLPDEYDAVSAIRDGLSELIQAAQFAERRGHDNRCDAMTSEGRPCSCGWQEYRDALTDALDAARGGCG